MEYLSYIIASILAIIVGQLTSHLCKKMPDWVSDKIDFKTYFKSLKKDFKIDYIYTIIYLAIFNLLIYFVGNQYSTYIYMLCIFSLVIVFNIDYRFELIPDECHVVISLLGIINMIFNFSSWYMYLLGAVVGGGFFYLLGALAMFIYKKEGMGFGDVKLMASLGLLFGLKTIVVISVLSFAIAAVISIILMITGKKKMDSYIPFGPFIVISTVLIIFFGCDVFIEGYLVMCTAIGQFFTNIAFDIINK